MYILDTDHMSLLERADSIEAHRLRKRMDKLPIEEKATSIVTFEEQMRGWMARLARSSALDWQIETYQLLKWFLERYCVISVLNFDEPAALKFRELQKQRVRIGTMDLKIAAIPLTNNATLLSRNLTKGLQQSARSES